MAKGLLKNIYLFEDFSDEEITLMEKVVTKRNVEGGQEIFSQGQKADSLFVISYGSIRLSQEGKGGDTVIRPLATGAHFGEMAMVDDQPRSASASAMEHTELLEISYAGLRALFLEQPAIGAKFYRSLAHYLSGRLRETTEQLGFARTHFRAG